MSIQSNINSIDPHFRKLPPLNISMLKELPYWKPPGKNPVMEKIENVLQNGYLITNETHTPFAKYSELSLGEFDVHTYFIREKNPNPIFDALGLKKKEKHSGKQVGYEFLIFLFKTNLSKSASTEDLGSCPVLVLSTNKAYKVVQKFCSQVFPSNISSSLDKLIIKSEQIFKGRLIHLSPSPKSYLQEAPSALEVKQRGLTRQEFTAILKPFVKCIEGSEVKVKFKKNGIIIYRDFSISEYVEIATNLIERDSNLENESKIKPVTDLPMESLVLDKTAVHELDGILADYIAKKDGFG